MRSRSRNGAPARVSRRRLLIVGEGKETELCLSNPCFEVWLLSHFERKAGAYNRCDAVVVRLNKLWQKHHRQDCRKNDDQIYYRVSDYT